MAARHSIRRIVIRRHLRVCLSLFLTIISGVSAFAQESQEFLKTGDLFYNKFNNIKALSFYEKALEITSNDFECQIKVIRAFNDVGEDLSSEKSEPYYEQAVQQAEQLQQMFPAKAESYYWLAVSYGNLALLRGSKEKVKLSEKVEKNIQKAIAMKPDYADAYVVLGIYYEEVAGLSSFLKSFARLFFGELPDGTYEDAVRLFRKAIALKTSRPIYTYFHLGNTYEQMNEVASAKSIYLKALQFPQTDHRDHIVVQQIKKRLQAL
ncbi:MAG: hypothetical protein D3906_13250 [Candidatus Electrothrix sp. AUS1_2]|nr:hypothetical protein [Candidatus Electrothrix sp. AUS1_2]